jgi:integrase
MASVRKRSWASATGETKTAWFVDYYDNRGQRQRKHSANKKAADAFRISVEGQLASGIYRPEAGSQSRRRARISLNIAKAVCGVMSG